MQQGLNKQRESLYGSEQRFTSSDSEKKIRV